MTPPVRAEVQHRHVPARRWNEGNVGVVRRVEQAAGCFCSAITRSSERRLRSITPSCFANADLAAAVELAGGEVDRRRTGEKYFLDAAFLKQQVKCWRSNRSRWDAESIGRPSAAEAALLEEDAEKRRAGPRELAQEGHRPAVLDNSPDKVEQIPGRIPGKGVGVHPMPKEFVAVVWTAPSGDERGVDADRPRAGGLVLA